jgi:hypothetical protein
MPSAGFDASNRADKTIDQAATGTTLMGLVAHYRYDKMGGEGRTNGANKLYATDFLRSI